jgi:hypothetical protein
LLTLSRPKGGITTPAPRRTKATGGVAVCGGGLFLSIRWRRKTRYGGFE